MGIYIFIGLIAGVVSGCIALERNRSPVAWCLIAMLFPLAVFALARLPSKVRAHLPPLEQIAVLRARGSVSPHEYESMRGGLLALALKRAALISRQRGRPS